MDKGDSPLFEPTPKPVNHNSEPTTSNKDSPQAKAARYKEIIDSLPEKPDDLLNQGWVEITDANLIGTNHRMFQNKLTGYIVRFDKGVVGLPGFKGKDHYHFCNPESIRKGKDDYIDANGNVVGRNSNSSHLLPKEKNE